LAEKNAPEGMSVGVFAGKWFRSMRRRQLPEERNTPPKQRGNARKRTSSKGKRVRQRLEPQSVQKGTTANRLKKGW